MKARFPIIAVLLVAGILPATVRAQAPAWLQLAGYSSETGGCDDCAAMGLNSCTNGCQCLSCQHRSMWADFEALMWWGKGRRIPALVTTSPAGTPQADAGVLGQPGTQILFGNGDVGNRIAAGARADFGMWMDPYQMMGLGGRVYGLDGDESRFTASSNGDPILARPFFNASTSLQDAVLVAFPGITTGERLDAVTDSSFIGTDAYVRLNVWVGQGYTVDLIGGYHFTRLDDSVHVRVNNTSVDPGGAVPIGTTFVTDDIFSTQNEFHGGMGGLIADAHYGCWSLRGLAKVSFGNIRQTVDINGSTTVTVPAGGAATSAGGLLTMPTNIGTFSRDESTFVPELGLTLAYSMKDWLELTVGYSVIYWPDVVLSGDQIDSTVNLSQAGGGPLVGPARPAFSFQETEYWLQGLNLGARVTY